MIILRRKAFLLVCYLLFQGLEDALLEVTIIPSKVGFSDFIALQSLATRLRLRRRGFISVQIYWVRAVPVDQSLVEA